MNKYTHLSNRPRPGTVVAVLKVIASVVAVVAIVVGMIIFAISTPQINEIHYTEYDKLKIMCQNDPTMKSLVLRFYSDGIITQGELLNIQDVYSKIKLKKALEDK